MNATQNSKPSRRNPGCALALLLLLVLLLASLWLAMRIGPHARAIYDALQDLQALRVELSGWPTPGQVARLRADIAALDDHGRALVDRSRSLFPLLRRLTWVPRVGADLATLPDLAEAGTQVLHGGRLLLDALLPALPPERPQNLQDLLPPVLSAVQAADVSLAEAEQAFDSGWTALRDVNPSLLSPPLAVQVERAQRWLPLAGKGVALLRLAPEVLGGDGERVWLVLAQNNEELRPTGGFISGVGEVRVRAGQVVSISFLDSYAFFNPRLSYPPPPEALRRTMKAELFLLRDANWWSDVPTSARVVARFYRLERGVDVDGIIALNLDAVRLLVDGLGGITLPNYDQPITGQTVIPFFYQAWSNPTGEGSESQVGNPDWWQQRKNFMRDVANAALTRVQAEPGRIPFPTLARNLVQALEERHLLLVSLRQGVAQEVLAHRGWDGALRPGEGDYLRVTDTNVGFNKVNAKVRLAMAYTVDLRTSPPAATLTLTYTHTSQVEIPQCIQEARYGDRYEDMQDRCYWNYLRVNRPAGTEVVSVEGLRPDTVVTGAGDVGTLEVAGLMVLPPGSTHTVTVHDRLPGHALTGGTYHLRLQKQPGTRAIPLTLRVLTSGGEIRRDLDLRTDLSVTLLPDEPSLAIRPMYAPVLTTP